MLKRGTVFFVVVVFMIFGVANALVEYNDGDLEREYRAGETISGSLNISFENELAEGLLTSNFPGNISLLDFLEKNELERGINFECDLGRCVDQFSAERKISGFLLSGEKVVGLKVSGNDIVVESIEFNVKSSLSESCGQPPFFIDVLSDGENIVSSDKHKNETCDGVAANYGCFSLGLTESKYTLAGIGSDNLCENRTILPGPAYKVGARIVNRTEKSGELIVEEMVMELMEFDGSSLGFCSLPEHSLEEENLECVVEYSSPYKRDVLVCIRNSDYSDANYLIRTEQEDPECGTNGRDLEIYVNPLKYDQANITVNNLLFENTGVFLEDYVNTYLEENYLEGSKVVCDPACIIPIEFSGVSQTLELDLVEVVYRDGSLMIYENDFYELSIEKAKISAEGIEVDLEKADFVIPLGSEEGEFKLRLNGNLIFEGDIEIEESFDFELNQKFVFFGRETQFTIATEQNISSATWDFDDGSVKESSGKNLNYRYLEEGEFNLTIILVASSGISAEKTFRVTVGKPKESANLTIGEYKGRIDNLEAQIGAWDIWKKTEADDLLGLDELTVLLNNLEEDFLNASTDEAYLEIMNGLLDLNVPLSVSVGSRGRLPLAVGLENIDVSYIEEISREEVESSRELRENIISWMLDHYSPEVEFEVTSVTFDLGEETLFSSFKIELNEKKEFFGEAYLFIDYPEESITFLRNYQQESVGGGTFILLGDGKSVEFLIKERIGVAELAAYISPGVRELGIVEKITPGEQPKFNMTLFIIGLSALVFVMLVIYMILQVWYKRNYENHLFKNGNDLYNLINFIYNARVSRLSDKTVREKLRGRGWKGEQITYAFRKIDGKRTGMWEIPIFKMFENRKVRKEIEKRQGGRVDARFIKL